VIQLEQLESYGLVGGVADEEKGLVIALLKSEPYAVNEFGVHESE
jgi:hypothetical protein